MIVREKRSNCWIWDLKFILVANYKGLFSINVPAEMLLEI